MSQQGKWFKQRYYRNINNYVSLGQCYFQLTSNLNVSQQGKWTKQRYYRNINFLSFCGPVLLSGNLQSERMAAGETVQITILSEP